MNNIDELLGSFDFLPPAPQVLPQLLSALAEPDTDLSHVVDLIAFDPGLTAKLLQTCNSAFFARSRPVDDVAEAVNRLGFQSVYRTVAVVAGAHCLRPAQTSGIDLEQLWRHSVITAFAAQFVAEDIQAESGMMFTAGLLHDLGKVVLAAAEARGRLAAGHCTEDFHADIGARLLHRWKFSAPLSLSVRFHHQPSGAGQHLKLAACIALANELAHHHDQPQTTDASLNGYENPLSILELNAPDLDRYRGRLEENVQFVETMCRI